MSKIGTLVTGAGVVTTINLNFVPEFIVVGGSYGAGVLSGLAWNIAGRDYVTLSGAGPVSAYGQFKNQGDLTNQLVDLTYQTGFGYVANQQFQIRLTNAGVTTPDIYGFSRRVGNGKLFTASQQVIFANANQRYANFLSLQFDATNLARANVTFRNPRTRQVFNDDFLPAELLSLFGLDNISEAGTLTGITVIDNINMLYNQGVYIDEIILYAGAGGNLTVTIQGIGEK